MSIMLNAIALPSNLLWLDEFDFPPFVQATQRTESGALIVQQSLLQAGRKISLVDDGSAVVWAPRSLIKTLFDTQQTLPTPMTLQLLDGRTFSVLWHADAGAPPMSTRPLVAFEDPAEETQYVISALRFITV